MVKDRNAALESFASIEAEALIREARRLRRRRWAIGLVIGLAIVASSITAIVLPSHTRPSARGGATRNGPTRAVPLPTGRVAHLDVAGSLAVGPSGVLYVASSNQHLILAHVAGGKFKVVAGTGSAGYSGNGGQAIDAELSDPTNLTFNANGDLYFVDSGRVRRIGTNGVIETVAGDGSSSWSGNSRPVATVTNQMPALSASFHSIPSIAFGPGDTLYIATAMQLLRITNDGRLDVIQTHRVSFGKVRGLPTSLDEGLDTIAVAKNGGIYVSGFNGWALWYVAPDGAATYVGNDRGSGGTSPDLTSGPGGQIYAEDGDTIARVTPKGLVLSHKFVKVDHQYFPLTYFAYGPRGSLYLDELPGNSGFEGRQQLVSDQGGTIKVLWTESKSAAAQPDL
jgi:hypothetical protein